MFRFIVIGLLIANLGVGAGIIIGLRARSSVSFDRMGYIVETQAAIKECEKIVAQQGEYIKQLVDDK